MKRGILLISVLLILAATASANSPLSANCTHDLVLEIGRDNEVTMTLSFSFYNQGTNCGFQVMDFDPRKPDPVYYQYTCNPGLVVGKWKNVSLFVFENLAGETIIGKRNFTFHVTKNVPCGQVLIRDIKFESTSPEDAFMGQNLQQYDAIPEFGAIAAGIAMIGALAGIILLRKR
jgi:hypothetical protein